MRAGVPYGRITRKRRKRYVNFIPFFWLKKKKRWKGGSERKVQLFSMALAFFFLFFFFLHVNEK